MFEPIYHINNRIMNYLMEIESLKQSIIDLPMTVALQKSLRETAKLGAPLSHN